MPMFEYKCTECGQVSEFLVGVTRENPQIVCESCGGTSLERMISPISFSMKESSSRFPIAGQCQCGQGESRGGCGGAGCSCSA